MMLLSPLLAIIVGIAETCPSNNFVRLGGTYPEAVRRGGNIPLVITRAAKPSDYDEIVAKIDLLILSGGEDVDPKYYGAAPSPKLGAINAVRDTFERDLLAAAVKRRLPILGICRGAQHLNVFFGGTLYQDLPSEYGPERYTVEHRTGKDKDAAFRERRHAIAIEPDSRLARVTGMTNAVVNSLHHQAVKRVAPGFRVVARSAEGSVEAIESLIYPAAGVQFHPEALLTLLDDPFAGQIFANLLEFAGKENGR